MGSGLPIQRLNMLALDNGLLEPVDIKTLQEELKNPTTQVQAMRTAISMIQKGYDLGVISSDVLKVFDTTNSKLKLLCNVYLRRCCMNRPACQLMCTHTFLKDFNDRNWEIQRCATEDAVELGDEVLIKNYVYDLKRMSMHDRQEIRKGTARALGLFYLKNKELFYEQGLEKILRKLVADPSEEVSTAALRTISEVEWPKENTNGSAAGAASSVIILTTEELITALKNSQQETKIHKTRGILCVLKNRQLSEKHIPLLRKLSASEDVAIFYLASKKLLELSHADLPYVFDQACGFMNLRNEQLYNVLLFVESIAKNIEPNSFNVAIHSEDPEYIVGAKIRIMFLLKSSLIASHLSEYAVNPKYNMQILELCLGNDVIINNILEYAKQSQLEVLFKTMLKFERVTESWAVIIAGYMQGSISVDMSGRIVLVKDIESQAEKYSAPNTGTSRKKYQTAALALEIVGKFCTEIPKWIFNLEYGLYCNEQIRLFCRLLNRGVIKSGECLLNLKGIQTKVPTSRRIKFIISHLAKMPCTSLAHLIHEKLEFTDTAQPSLPGARLDFAVPEMSDDVHFRNSIMHSRPYVDSGVTIPENYSSVPSTPRSSNDIEIIQKIPLYINTPNYKGYLEISGDNFILRTEYIEGRMQIFSRVFAISNNTQGTYIYGQILANPGLKKHEIAADFVSSLSHTDPLAHQPPTASNACTPETSIVVGHPGIQSILTIKPEMIGCALSITVKDRSYLIVLGLQLFIKPLVCEEAFHEQRFAELEKYTIVDTFDLENVHAVSDTLFSFSLLGHSVYGKSYSNQIVLKSDGEILRILQKAAG